MQVARITVRKVHFKKLSVSISSVTQSIVDSRQKVDLTKHLNEFKC